jgi:hypothetical protein
MHDRSVKILIEHYSKFQRQLAVLVPDSSRNPSSVDLRGSFVILSFPPSKRRPACVHFPIGRIILLVVESVISLKILQIVFQDNFQHRYRRNCFKSSMIK